MQVYVRPKLPGNQKWPEEYCRWRTDIFILGTNLTGWHIFMDVFYKSRPPEQVLEEGYSAVFTRMAHGLHSMSPLDDLALNWGRYKKKIVPGCGLQCSAFETRDSIFQDSDIMIKEGVMIVGSSAMASEN